MALDPLTKKKFRRFKSIKRGYYSFIAVTALILLSLIAEIIASNRALVVKYDGDYHFPSYGAIIPGKTFGFDYDYETNYRDLQARCEEQNNGNFVIMPIIPYNAYETDFIKGEYPPYAPSAERRHYMGTDKTGRDVCSRLIYGFRIAIFFSLVLLFCNYTIGISLGCLMGYWGGWFDLLFQRIIEIWSNVPFLYVVIIVASIMVPNFFVLVGIMVIFGWMGMTWYMRTATYKEKTRDYVLAAQALGASNSRIIFKHIMPNTISLIVTFIPFSVAGGVVALTSLDYLGYGLPPPTPSWGQLLDEGTTYLDQYWIGGSVIVAMTVLLTMVTFIGEAVREAFDPKMHTTYE
jgi:microcin C transport system permease protein